jgi:hypothetical protein
LRFEGWGSKKNLKLTRRVRAGLGLRIYDSGFRGLGFGLQRSGLQVSGFRDPGFRFRISEIRVSGFRVLGFRV